MSQTQLGLLGRLSATKIIKTAPHLDTTPDKTLAGGKDNTRRHEASGLIHEVYCEGNDPY